MQKKLSSMPLTDGYVAPIELAEHVATLALWPERPDVWRDGAKPIQNLMIELITTISKYEKVYLGVSKENYEHVSSLNLNNVIVYIAEYDDMWIRDTGPIFVKEKDVRGVSFEFNAWGGESGLYKPWDKDNRLAPFICEEFSYKYYDCSMVLEGGSISVDGCGLGIATSCSIINENRNPNLGYKQVNNYLKDYLGIEKMLWLSQGYAEDETGGHIDNFCVFINENELILSWCDDQSDDMYSICRNAERELYTQSKKLGIDISIHRVPTPKPIYASEEDRSNLVIHNNALKRVGGERLTASYINSYFINGAVLVPKFSCPEDEEAAEVFSNIIKGRDILQIESKELLLGGGGIHCAFMQVPK